jgi:subtilisin family serine protease
MAGRPKWLRWAAAGAAAAALIAFLPWQAGERTGGGDGSGLDAAQEKRQKMAAVRRDAEATAKLCTLECSKEFRSLRADDGREKLRRLLEHHPHMRYVRVKSGEGRTTEAGEMPEGGSWEKLLAAAERDARAGRAHVSDPVRLDGERYVVLGVPAAGGDGTVVSGIVRQTIVDEVERRQKQFLRLVPYPAEGRYKTESARPNSTEDITVRTGEDNGSASHYHINEAVVRFRKPPTDAEMKAIMKDIDGASVRKLGYAHVFTSHSMETEELIDYFRERWNPVYAEPHYLYLANGLKSGGRSGMEAKAGNDADAAGDVFVPNDLLYGAYQWNLPAIETERGWALSRGSDDIVIAVLDTGVQLDHPDLKGRITEGINLVGEGGPEDDVGHGTHVAGIIAATVNNGEGVAGLSWRGRIMPVKVLDSTGSGTTYSVAEGIIWATDHGADVINMSLGNYASAEFLHDAIRYAYDRGVVLVAASGNDNTDQPGYPAAYPEVFAVAATDAEDGKAPYSNYGDYIDVAAPGDAIASTYPGNQYAALSGTSMASPHVAALAGLIKSVNPDLTNEEVMDIMRKTAVDLGEKGRDPYFGYGRIDVVRALKAAEQAANTLGGFRLRFERRIETLRKQFGLGTAE